MLHHAIILGLLLIFWLVCSAFMQPFFIIAGVFSSLVAWWCACRLNVIDDKAFHLFFPIRSISYVFWLMKEILMSTLRVTSLVWRVVPPISPVFAWVPTQQKDDVGRTIYANSITLTPGTVSVAVREDEILVHALEQSSMDALAHESEMDARIASCLNTKEKKHD